ncbi:MULTISPECIES: GNAT family N-acetyltransferase [Sphingobium]|uniref:GNAT family N-acetyltransferase n=1 Tax=Sphingobium TaxID=165695 RepID=UPI0015EB86CD|nr:MULTISPECIES: GNAT family N-acetyltransferase [Sphingobium]MCW2364145.1 putative GNAT family acetyltransferase [Sphingobium sp. B10D3B]MCW2402458.1 putative GNAT family acetyltransferase [Sphingobium sp. B10D7B]MCW2409437.1 putative GNAT family acetyltransferase [Sphingobium xanthum]
MAHAVQDNAERNRYEITVDGEIAFATYERDGDTLAITHTFTPPALRGKGVAADLVAGLLDDARARGLKIRPVCSYVVTYFERHPDQRDLLAA